MKTIKYDLNMDLSEMQELIDQGVKIICHRCGAQLITALDAKSARQQGVHPGIYCPVSQTHVAELIELAESHQAMRTLFNKMS
jgi:hypothetical protein